MSKIPDTKKTKYNNNDAFRWVDSQWEKFMEEQKELKTKIVELEEKSKNDNDYIGDLEQDNYRLVDMITELRKTVREIGGKDLYNYLYPLKDPNQTELFNE